MYALQKDGSKHKDANGAEDWTAYSGEHMAELTKDYQNFAIVFEMNSDTDEGTILSISMGAVGGQQISDRHSVVIDNITLEEIQPQ